jgi:Flp pilus assembly protein TadG
MRNLWPIADRAIVADLARDERGVVALFVIVALGVFSGVAALVIDAGRLYSLHSQLQAYADHVALAAAAELDGEAGSINRATLAALGDGVSAPLVLRGHTFGNSPDGLQVDRLVFLATLGDDPDPADLSTRPAGDGVLCSLTAGGASTCAPEHDPQATFVEVTVQAQEVSYFIAPVLRVFGVAAAADHGTAMAQATAGFTREVCNFPPLMICNPYEDDAFGGPGADFTPIPGMQVRAKMDGSGASWGPGIFGVLDAIDGEGADAVRDAMARVDPNTRCVSARVDVKPGENTGPVYQGLNIRFDMFNPPLHQLKGNPQYTPAPNVTKGIQTQLQGPQCNSDVVSSTTMPLPRDQCFTNGINCLDADGRFGTGDWDRDAYWDANHAPLGHAKPAGYDAMTRYEVYRWEIEANQIPDTADENGAPTCATTTPNTDAVFDRRVLIVAVVNCRANEAILHGNAADVPVEAFAKIFFTEPVGNTLWGADPNDIFVEVVGRVEAGERDGVLHEFPQLYR